MTKKPTHVGVFILRHKGTASQILLIARDPKQNKYFLPGGAIEPEESELSAASREAREETGIVVNNPLADLGIITRPGRDEAGQKYVKTIRYYLYVLNENEAPNGWEIKAEKDKKFYCYWKDLNQFDDLIYFPQEKQLATTAKRFLPKSILPGF